MARSSPCENIKRRIGCPPTILGYPAGILSHRRIDQRMVSIGQIYSTPQRSAQQLIQGLLQGPQITVDDLEALLSFASSCEAEVYMKQRDNLEFASLYEYTTQETIFARLSNDFHVKRCEHRWTALQAELAPFEKFAS